jgi:hypothetical protein
MSAFSVPLRIERAPTYAGGIAGGHVAKGTEEAWPRIAESIHRVLPRRTQRPWKCGQFPVRKMRPFCASRALPGHGRRVRLRLHRARSASRSKQLPRAVGGSRRFTGDVDESATGSVNFFGPVPLEHAARKPISCCAQRSVRKLRASLSQVPCVPAGHPLGFLLHRARSASRSKQLPRAVGGSRRFTGDVDESATGSVNFFWSNDVAPCVPCCARCRAARLGLCR